MSDESNSSFFSAVRAVVCFITADGKYDPKERTWFLTLIDGYGLSRSERARLVSDFENPPKLEDLWREIHRHDDRDRLLRWARGVIAVDGDVAQAEKRLLARLEALNARGGAGDLQESYRQLAAAVVEHEKENRLWNELYDFGQIMNRRYVGYPMFGGLRLPLLWPEGPLNLKTGSSRPFYWMMIVMAVFVFAMFAVQKCGGT